MNIYQTKFELNSLSKKPNEICNLCNRLDIFKRESWRHIVEGGINKIRGGFAPSTEDQHSLVKFYFKVNSRLKKQYINSQFDAKIGDYDTIAIRQSATRNKNKNRKSFASNLNSGIFNLDKSYEEVARIIYDENTKFLRQFKGHGLANHVVDGNNLQPSRKRTREEGLEYLENRPASYNSQPSTPIKEENKFCTEHANQIARENYIYDSDDSSEDFDTDSEEDCGVDRGGNETALDLRAFGDYDFSPESAESERFYVMMETVYQKSGLSLTTAKSLLYKSFRDGNYHENMRELTQKIEQVFSHSGVSENLENPYGTAWRKITICRNHCILFVGNHSMAETCHICSKKRDDSYKIVYLSPREWVRKLYKNPQMATILKREKSSDNISDIWSSDYIKDLKSKVVQNDPRVYNEKTERHYFQTDDELLFSLHLDGAGLFSFKTEKFNVIALALHNIPLTDRFTSDNMLPIFIYPKKKAKQENVKSGKDTYSFLYPIVEDFAQMSFGFQVYDAHLEKEVKLYAHLVYVSGDISAIAEVSGMAGHNGLLSCRTCFMGGSENGVTASSSEEDIEKRNEAWFNNNKSNDYFASIRKDTGVSAISPLFLLGSIHPIWSFPFECMSLFYENFTKKFLQILFSFSMKNRKGMSKFSINDENRKRATNIFEEMNAKVEDYWLTDRLNVQQIMNEQSAKTAALYKAIVSIFPIFLYELEGNYESLLLFSQFSLLFRVIAATSISKEHIKYIEQSLQALVKQYKHLFVNGKTENCSICGVTLHSLVHFAEYILKTGLPRCFWAFGHGLKVDEFKMHVSTATGKGILQRINNISARSYFFRLTDKEEIRLKTHGRVLREINKAKFPDTHSSCLLAILRSSLKLLGDDALTVLQSATRYSWCILLSSNVYIEVDGWAKISISRENNLSIYAKVEDIIEVKSNNNTHRFAIISPVSNHSLQTMISPNHHVNFYTPSENNTYKTIIGYFHTGNPEFETPRAVPLNDILSPVWLLEGTVDSADSNPPKTYILDPMLIMKIEEYNSNGDLASSHEIWEYEPEEETENYRLKNNFQPLFENVR